MPSVPPGAVLKPALPVRGSIYLLFLFHLRVLCGLRGFHHYFLSPIFFLRALAGYFRNLSLFRPLRSARRKRHINGSRKIAINLCQLFSINTALLRTNSIIPMAGPTNKKKLRISHNYLFCNAFPS